MQGLGGNRPPDTALLPVYGVSALEVSPSAVYTALLETPGGTPSSHLHGLLWSPFSS